MKLILDLYFKLFRAVFNKLPIFTNKTGKSNWDWLKLNKNDTFTKVLGVLFFWGLLGVYLIVLNWLINNNYVFQVLQTNNLQGAINKISLIKLHFNNVVTIWFVSWLITMLIILKNHRKKPNIQKIF